MDRSYDRHGTVPRGSGPERLGIGLDVPAATARDRDPVARRTITIVLELDEATGTPAGHARVPGGPSREFHGWIGLTEAIDALARTPEGVSHSEPSHERETS